MTTALLDKNVQTELSAVAERSGCELIHLDYAGGMLRLVLDRPEGVTVEECARVSRDASVVLDALDFGSGRYTLEVSSPGLNREFYRNEDYDRFTGSCVKITWRDPETANNRTDVGILAAHHAGDGKSPSIDLEIGDDRINIRLASVIKARLEPEL